MNSFLALLSFLVVAITVEGTCPNGYCADGKSCKSGNKCDNVYTCCDLKLGKTGVRCMDGECCTLPAAKTSKQEGRPHNRDQERWLLKAIKPSSLGSGASIQLATVPYWNNEFTFCNGEFNFDDNEVAYDAIPPKSIAVLSINEAGGIVGTQSPRLQEYGRIISKGIVPQRDVRFLAYVPTGYANRTHCATNDCHGSLRYIESQLHMWNATYPAQLSGVFFDEFEGNPEKTFDKTKEEFAQWAARDCARGRIDMQTLRLMAKKYIKSDAVIAWNPAWFGADLCFLKAAAKDEIVMYETSFCKYFNTCVDAEGKRVKSDVAEHMELAAKTKHDAKAWHCVIEVPNQDSMVATVEQAIKFKADYVYITDTGAGYKTAPKYYKEEISYIASKNKRSNVAKSHN